MKIVFVKLGAIGDIIQAAAALWQFRSENPDAHICWVAGKQVVDLIHTTGIANEVIEIDDKSLLVGTVFNRIIGLFKAITALVKKGQYYDLIIKAYTDWRYTLLSIGVLSRSRRRFIKHSSNFSINSGRNRTFEYWRLFSRSKFEKIDVRQSMEAVGNAILKNSSPDLLHYGLPNNYVILAPGGAKNMLRNDDLRRWPVDRYFQIAQKLSAIGKNVVIVGGIGDSWVSEKFQGLPVLDLVGLTSLFDLIHVMDRADLVITHDSGPLHLAAITHTSIIAIFGPTPPNAVISFARPKTIVLHAANRVACCPCYDGQNYALCSNAKCMDSITVDAVWEAVSKV